MNAPLTQRRYIPLHVTLCNAPTAERKTNKGRTAERTHAEHRTNTRRTAERTHAERPNEHALNKATGNAQRAEKHLNPDTPNKKFAWIFHSVLCSHVEQVNKPEHLYRGVFGFVHVHLNMCEQMRTNVRFCSSLFRLLYFPENNLQYLQFLTWSIKEISCGH